MEGKGTMSQPPQEPSQTSEHLARAADDLAAVTASTLELLDGHAKRDDLALGAYELGSSLLSLAADDALWHALAPRPVGSLNEQQRLKLQKAAVIDWPENLNQIGYRPPPPADIYGSTFQREINRALKKDELDLRGIRDKIRDLGRALETLGRDSDASPSRLRRALRRGAQVAKALTVAVGFSAAAVGLSHALPPAMAAAAITLAISQTTAAEFLGELLKKVVLTPLEERAKRGLYADKDEVLAEYADDRMAVRYFDALRQDTLEGLLRQWTGLSERSQAERELRTKSKRFVEDLIRRLYIVWDGALGADWYTADLGTRFEDLRNQSLRLRAFLRTPEIARAHHGQISVAFAALALDVSMTKALLHQDIAPLGPVADRIAKIEALEELTAILDRAAAAAASHANSVRMHADLWRRSRHGQAPPEEIARREAAVNTAELTAHDLWEQAQRARHRLEDLRH